MRPTPLPVPTSHTPENEMKSSDKISTRESIRRPNCSFWQKPNRIKVVSRRAHERRRRAALRCTLPCKWRWDLEPNQHAICAPRPTLPPTPHTVRSSVGPCTLLQLHYHFITLSLSQLRSYRTPSALPTFSHSFFAFEQQQHLLSKPAAMFSSNDQITLLLLLPSRSGIGTIFYIFFKGEGLHPLGHSRLQISRYDISG